MTSRSAPTPASSAALFLARYERPDGRVARYDQGGDTVSEGQAFALLIAAGTGNRARFDAAWRWAADHLQQPDGLFAWHWESGRVVGYQPATDADVMTAAALLSAAATFHEPALGAAGTRVAEAVLAHETVGSSQAPVLVAGPWAAAPPAFVNPSYLAVPLLEGLAGRLGGEWKAVASVAARQLLELTRGGSLPPDWAVLGPDGLRPSPPPGHPGGTATYGFDAVRVPIWLASSCSQAGRGAAAALLPALERGRGELGLDRAGRPDPGSPTPLALVGEAASASAAGRGSLSRQLLSRAASADAARPAYYTTAVLAVAELGLSHRLGAC